MEDKLDHIRDKIRAARADLSQRLRDLDDYTYARPNENIRAMERQGIRDPEQELYIIIGYIQREIRRLEARYTECADKIAIRVFKTHYAEGMSAKK